jgi:hypothetical protein
MTVPTMSSRADTYSAMGRFNNLLQGIGWDPNNLWYGYAKFTQQAIVSNGRTVRDEIGLIADSEGGWQFTDRIGRITFFGRDWPNQEPRLKTVQAELLATPTRDIPVIDAIPTVPNVPIVELRGLVTDWTRDRIVNILQIANQAGSAFTYNNYLSQQKYGPFSYQRLDFVNDNAGEPSYANQRANDYMTGYTDPVLRVNSVSFRPDASNLKWAATVWLNDLLRVRYEHPEQGWGFLVCTHVQGFTHTLTPTSWEMSTTLDHPESFTYYQNSGGAGWDEGTWDINLWDEFGDEPGYWDSGEVWTDAANPATLPIEIWGP